jgi:CRP/FNR family transcriptional regulator, cyclic AMP receptor protein
MANMVREPNATVRGSRTLEPSVVSIFGADALADQPACGPVIAVDAWIRDVVAQYHPALHREVCPFIAPAIERHTLFYAPVTGCRSPDHVIVVMEELVSRFENLRPQDGPDARLKTLSAIFIDVQPEDAHRIVVAAHHELKNRCTAQGLMVGEFAPGYWLPSTRNAALNVGEAPAPVLVLRHMLISDRRFLETEDQWMAAWASWFGTDRVPLFRPFSNKELAAVGRLSRELSIEAGQQLCHQGDPGDELFLIIHGQATVSRDQREIATIGPGMYFGELALLTDRPRNATVTASTDMTLLALDRRAFRQVVDSVPSVVHKLLAGLAERLGQADEVGSPMSAKP